MSEDDGRFSSDIGFGVFLRDGSVHWPEGWDLKEKHGYLRVRSRLHLIHSPDEPDYMLAAIERAVRTEEIRPSQPSSKNSSNRLSGIGNSPEILGCAF